LRKLLWFFYKTWDYVVLRLVFNIEIPAECHIGPGLNLLHKGVGVIIHPHAIIGENVAIYHQVTIGSLGLAHQMREDRPPSNTVDGVALIGDRVLIGAGAKIIGPVSIGNNARIGANAVVVTDIPQNATAVGVPARIIKVS